jgi:UDP-glucose 4-epimerase
MIAASTPQKRALVDLKPGSTILVTGAAGGLSSVVIDQLAESYRLVGVDPRPMPYGRNFPGKFYQVDYMHRRMTEIFRRHEFAALLHLGRVAATSESSAIRRYNVNVLGTRNLLHLARAYGVGRVIVFSTFHVYGAHQHNHLHIAEDEPLRASPIFPELSDAIELDNYARTFSLQYPEVKTLVVRPVNVVGARIRNEISRLLRSDYVPTLLGYDPMLQFIHEADVARALSLALESSKSGVYNLAGEGLVSYSKSIELAGGKPVPIPHFLVYPVLGALARVVKIPKHLVDYFRYPVVIRDAAFRRDFGFVPEVSTVEALASLRSSASFMV